MWGGGGGPTEPPKPCLTVIQPQTLRSLVPKVIRKWHILSLKEAIQSKLRICIFAASRRHLGPVLPPARTAHQAVHPSPFVSFFVCSVAQILSSVGSVGGFGVSGCTKCINIFLILVFMLCVQLVHKAF